MKSEKKHSLNLISIIVIGLLITIAIMIFVVQNYKKVNSQYQNNNTSNVENRENMNELNNTNRNEIENLNNIYEEFSTEIQEDSLERIEVPVIEKRENIEINKSFQDEEKQIRSLSTEELVKYYYNKVTNLKAEYQTIDTNYISAGLEIINFDYLMENTFTPNGRKIYENEDELYFNIYGRHLYMIGDDHYDECLYDLDVENVEETENEIKATIVRTMTDGAIAFMEDDEIQTCKKEIFKSDFVLKKADNKWLVDDFEWRVYSAADRYIKTIYQDNLPVKEDGFIYNYMMCGVTEESEMVTAQIIEYKYNDIYKEETNKLKLYNINTNEIVKEYDISYTEGIDGEVSKEEYLEKAKYDIELYVNNFDSNFSTATIKLDRDKNTGELTINSIER